MKNIILGLALISSSAISSAFACSPEAQFIGTVNNVTAECTYEINFTMFNPSMVCPLSIDEALTVYTDKNCAVKNGDIVSGILVVKDNKVEIE